MFLFMHFIILKRSPETFWFTLDLYLHSCMHVYHSRVNMMNRVLGYCDSDLKIQIKITTVSHIAVEVLSGLQSKLVKKWKINVKVTGIRNPEFHKLWHAILHLKHFYNSFIIIMHAYLMISHYLRLHSIIATWLYHIRGVLRQTRSVLTWTKVKKISIIKQTIIKSAREKHWFCSELFMSSN